ncbi:MAG: pyrimidine 5'-nucleotidase [Anaerolineae bacterium]|jgi:putative hydrolase of the HAD superfamily|nr:pyrimidine 5'-nucleotidase [Anaerolineae bacterium]MBT7072560.1 pyrimidine 5'-nucleotidase [Anaerolineae bacterium]MBT7324614.1 pyrimidine 5'-nucleotidase [Anaerolineae bacterium]
MKYTTIFFDLDDTLYSHESGLWEAIRDRICLYMHEELGMSWDEIPAKRDEYFQAYGTTLRGIQAHFDVDESLYHAYVHQIPLDGYIAPDPNLTALLEHLSQRKIIFTSADAAHAERVLAHLEIRGYFEEILDIYALEPYAKPQPEAFKRALELVGESDPHTCVMIDDLPRTTSAARDYGLFSILKGNKGNGTDANAQLENWQDLPKLLNGK